MTTCANETDSDGRPITPKPTGDEAKNKQPEVKHRTDSQSDTQQVQFSHDDDDINDDDVTPIESTIDENQSDDMVFVVEWRQKLTGRMNWMQCFEAGKDANLFRRYRSHLTLKQAFNQHTFGLNIERKPTNDSKKTTFPVASETPAMAGLWIYPGALVIVIVTQYISHYDPETTESLRDESAPTSSSRNLANDY
ncbi:hypothetical protein DM01DRAFT_1373881 [Hesseltinella vesiculosa]|uniref:Uncharacterized protein n=1 Tax=Hesseltinella vesiculosa TaxID=101127 RepID=A0A1X2GI89_9FUNG|nr:hypothetical protein DM01DRAFT_1373881 [Hesseltinella vesiculosa]